MDWFPVNVYIQDHYFCEPQLRIDLGAGQDNLNMVTNLPSTKGDSVKALRRASNRKRPTATDFVKWRGVNGTKRAYGFPARVVLKNRRNQILVFDPWVHDECENY